MGLPKCRNGWKIFETCPNEVQGPGNDSIIEGLDNFQIQEQNELRGAGNQIYAQVCY